MIIFTLSFPTNGAWNGKFSGAENLYAEIRSIKDRELVKKLLESSPYIHRWNDGWTASIEVSEVKGPEAQKIKRNSKGFMGYEWMVNSIVDFGSIMTEKQIKQLKCNHRNEDGMLTLEYDSTYEMRSSDMYCTQCKKEGSRSELTL